MDDSADTGDPFEQHFQHDLPEDSSIFHSKSEFSTSKQTLPVLRNISFKIPCDTTGAKSDKGSMSDIEIIDNMDWDKFHIKSQIQQNIIHACNVHTGQSTLTKLQLELLSIISKYKDLYFNEETVNNREEIKFVYCLHAINHALKTRLKIIHHNSRLSDKEDVPDEFRDQGLVRPKVLILVPFRSSAFKIVKIICSILLSSDKDNIINKKRFLAEFSGDDISESQKSSKPEDFSTTFCGNIDDNFRLGITITKKSLKLYADFYSADIIVASPLGLRMIIGAEGDAERDYDFLASIEVLIMDQTEIFLMQNWDHVLHIMDHLHLQPKQSHGTNFARVRLWSVNGWSKYYRQTLVFSAYPLPDISALVGKKCHNYSGLVRTNNSVTYGTICQVVVKVPQVFYQIQATSAIDAIDRRFDLFVNKILPQFNDNQLGHILIYVPSYFDFVRLRNYFIKEMVSFVQICEYTKDGKVAEARDKFFHREANFLLYSERFHFYNRRQIRGIRHLVFYQLPTFPNFYSEMCNLMQESYRNRKQRQDSYNITVIALYSKYDIAQLSSIVTTERAMRLLSSQKEVHLFATDDI